jgi:uroporphyrinogen decarboxylase
MTELSGSVKPDAEAFLANLRREGTPRRVHFMELFLDAEIKEAVCRRFDLTRGLSDDDPFHAEKREIAIQRFLGYDYVYAALPMEMPLFQQTAEDPAGRVGGRAYQDEHRGPIMSWEDFERYPWPDPHEAPDRSFVWHEENLPDDMCVVPNCRGHFAEHLTWLMGYETLCYALYDQRELVRAVADKILQTARVVMGRLLQFHCVKAVWGSDDMGFKTATLISPADLREFVLPGHKVMAEMAHAAGRPYLLHACGNLREVIPDLLDDVKIDAKHSFEDTIELVTDAKRQYGRRCALLGGIDVDFLCRADQQAIRKRVRQTLDVCMPGGGYCLGSGNSVANYVPVDNYLAMLDEGRRYA